VIDKMSYFEGKNILITGGLGFIGSNLVHKYVELGANVTILDCLDPSAGGNLFNVQDIRQSISIQYSNIENFDQVSNAVSDKDIIFNCAAFTSHSGSMKDPWINNTVNCVGTINLLEAIRRFNCSVKLIHVGTSTQIGKMVHQPINETHSEFPLDFYSANKVVSEKYVLIYAKMYGIRATCIRLSNGFGPRANISRSDLAFNNYFIGLALQGKDILVYGTGDQKRNILYVDDAVNALILASQSEKTNAETFFAVSDEHFSVAQIAETIVKIIGSGRVKYVEWPNDKVSTEIGDAIISNEKIKSVLPWTPQISLETGLTMTKEYYKKYLNEYLR